MREATYKDSTCPSHIVMMREYTGYVNFFPRARDIDQIIEKDNIFTSRDMPWWDGT